MNPMTNQTMLGVPLHSVYASGGDPLDPASAGRNWSGPGYAHIGTTAAAGLAGEPGVAGAHGTSAAGMSGEPGVAAQSTYAANPGQSTGSVAHAISDTDRVGLEAQALHGFLQQATASSIRRLFQYLESHSAAFPQLNAQMPVLSQAVAAYRAGDFPHAFAASFQVYRAIVLTQAMHREMPTIQTL